MASPNTSCVEGARPTVGEGGPSVALATYNGERHLSVQLASLAAQTLLPAELVVADDGSTDGTLGIVRAFAETAPFSVRVLDAVGRTGPTEAFARAVDACAATVVAFCDQDDWWHPGKLAALAAPFADPGVTCAVCDARLVDERLAPLGRTLWEQVGFKPAGAVRLARPERVLMGPTVAFGLTMAVRNGPVLATHALPVPPQWGHDGWTALVAAALGRVALVNRPLVDYRQHAGQVSSAGAVGALARAAERLAPRNAALLPDARAFGTLVDRLDAVPPGERGPDWSAVREHAAGVAEHLGAREALPTALPARLTGVARQVRAYGRYSNGWRSVVRDVVWGPPTGRGGS